MCRQITETRAERKEVGKWSILLPVEEGPIHRGQQVWDLSKNDLSLVTGVAPTAIA